MPLENPFKKLSKPQLYAAIGGSVLIGGFIEYKHHSSTGSWNPFSKAPAATGSAIDPVTNLPVSEDTQIDPVTDLPYLQEAQQYGSVSAAEASVAAFGASSPTGNGIGVSPASPGQAGSTNLATGAVSASTYTSNAAWVQAAVAGLTDVGYSATDVATALGDYVTQTPVTATQAQLINTAIAEYGPAPVGNLQIIQTPVSKPAATVKVPGDLIGQSQEAAFAILSAAGLKATGTPVVKGKVLIVHAVSPPEGTAVAPGTTIKLTSSVSK